MIHSLNIAGLSPIELDAKNMEYLEDFPRTPTKALSKLIADRCKNQKELSFTSGLSESTISRMCREKNFPYDIKQITRLVIGLKLPPALSAIFMELVGFSKAAMIRYYRYQCIIDCLFMDDIETVVEAHRELFEK